MAKTFSLPALPLRVTTTFAPTQRHAARLFRECDVLFLLGPAGTGKSHLAVALALQHAIHNECRIVLTRPVVEAGESLGYLPGDVNEKMAPYLAPIIDLLPRVCNDPKQAGALLDVCPLAFMRGRTFNGVAILDEAQNCTLAHMRLFLSRLGVGGKMIVTGDVAQSDIADSGLAAALDCLHAVPGVGIVEMTDADQQRHPLVTAMLAELNLPRGKSGV